MKNYEKLSPIEKLDYLLGKLGKVRDQLEDVRSRRQFNSELSWRISGMQKQWREKP